MSLLKTLAALVSLMLLALAGFFVWVLYFEKPFLEYQGLPFLVAAPVRAGEAIQLHIVRCNHDAKKRSYRNTRTLIPVDGKSLSQILPSTDAEIDPGCHRMNARVNIPPPTTPPGMYRVRGVALVDGIFKTHKVEWYSEEFEVLP